MAMIGSVERRRIQDLAYASRLNISLMICGRGSVPIITKLTLDRRLRHVFITSVALRRNGASCDEACMLETGARREWCVVACDGGRSGGWVTRGFAFSGDKLGGTFSLLLFGGCFEGDLETRRMRGVEDLCGFGVFACSGVTMKVGVAIIRECLS
jgi:hypothetical protein